jgi:DMSO reductase anchor subunit
VQPALSVIFFTTLSGAGYGMLIWLGVLLLADAFSQQRTVITSPLFWLVSLCFASVLIAIGLLSSMLHLGKPARAWRAFSQWRTSWLSREGVMSLLTYVPVLALLLLIGVADARPAWRSAFDGPWAQGLAVAMIVGATITIVCTAMIYASLKTIPAWRHSLVGPGYLAFALLNGGALIAMLISLTGFPAPMVRPFASAILLTALATIALKVTYWRGIDRQDLPATRGDAIGLPDREISLFERPHTEENYVTREMAFAVARKHAQKLRAIALVLFGVVPILAAAVAARFTGGAAVAFTIAAVAALAGAFAERWLFFAEARHVVTLYY